MDKDKIILVLRQSHCFYTLQKLYNKYFPVRGRNNVIKGKPIGGGRIRIVGNDNIIEFKKGCLLNKIPITVFGNGNRVVIGEKVRVLGGSILCDGQNCTINIGRETSIQSAHINAQEHSEIRIGERCMFSANIVVRTSDSHTIYDVNTKKRLNPAKSVTIGNHVWLAASVYVLKGVTLGDNSIIGTGSIVTHDVPENSIAVGVPAKVVKHNVNWAGKLMD